jgi:hypothetical protein
MSDGAPETPHEYARRRVEELRTVPIDIFGQPVRFLNTDDAERFAGHAIAHLLRAEMIDRDAAAKVAKDGDPLFQHALGLLGMADRPKKLRIRRRRETNYFRDIAITMLIDELLEHFPSIKATTSAKAGNRGCACGMVADVMGLRYDAVCKVWGRLGKQL